MEKQDIIVFVFDNCERPYVYLGRILKEYRENLNYSISDVSIITDLPVNMLHDIENGNFCKDFIFLVYRLTLLYRINLILKHEKLQ